MIDLTKGLPDAIEVSGKSFFIKTDFREWLKFGQILKNLKKYTFADLQYLFVSDVPDTPELLSALISFYENKNELPRATGKSMETIVLDYDIDAEYLYADFLREYGIDLIDIEYLHWHKFLALVRGLSIRMSDIMQYRTYEKTNEKPEEIYTALQESWRIDLPLTQEEQEKIDEFNKYFG